MRLSLRVPALWIIALLLMAATAEGVFAQTRGRTSGRTEETSRSGSNDSGRTAPSSSRSDDEAKAPARERKETPEQPEARSAPKPITESAQKRTRSDDTDRSRSDSEARTSDRARRDDSAPASRGGTATSRDDRQRPETGRPERERRPAETPAPEREQNRGDRDVDESPRNVDRRNNNDSDVRGRDADRAANRGRRVQPPVVVVTPPRPHVHVDARWPWEWRRRNHWSPRYRYRQKVFIDAGWLGHRRSDQVEIETTYRHRLRRADSRRAEIDVYIERIAVFDRGRFIGEVRRIPDELARIRATVSRTGPVRFDREIFLVGNRFDGLELISTRYYDGYVLDHYDRRHGFRAGRLDFRRDRVVSIRRSRFFDPFHFDGYVPLSLLPDDRGWLLDYGRDSITGRYYDSRGDWGDYDDYDAWDDRGWSLGNYRLSTPGDDRLEREYQREITTKNGAVIGLQREEVIERLPD
ncbi:MAG TPA: hypothetical protein VF190_15370 [Rhodothermales bacterium]